MSSLGERLKELRGPVSQAQMARELGMKQPQYARYESGASSPSAEVIIKMCDVFCCSADDILGTHRGTSAAVVVNGSGNAVANGVHARASVVLGNAGETPICKKCKYLKAIKKLQKAGLQLPD